MLTGHLSRYSGEHLLQEFPQRSRIRGGIGGLLFRLLAFTNAQVDIMVNSVRMIDVVNPIWPILLISCSWCTAGFGDFYSSVVTSQGYIRVDLEDVKSIEMVYIWANFYGSTRSYSIVRVGNDGDLYSNNHQCGDAVYFSYSLGMRNFTCNSYGRYVWLVQAQHMYRYELREIRIYGFLSCPHGTTSLPGLAPTRCNCKSDCKEGVTNASGTCQQCPSSAPLTPIGKAARDDTGCDVVGVCEANTYYEPVRTPIWQHISMVYHNKQAVRDAGQDCS